MSTRKEFPPTEMTLDQFDSRLCMLQFDGPSHEKIVVHDHLSVYLYIRDTGADNYYILVHSYEVPDSGMSIIDIAGIGDMRFTVRIATSNGRIVARVIDVVYNTLLVS